MSTFEPEFRPTSNHYSVKSNKVPSIPHSSKGVASNKEMELQFRIFSYTSQESDGKAENLTIGGDFEGNIGWHSKRFWEYPQEIIVYFNSPVKLTKLVILSHQNKISSQIDLHSYLPSVKNEISASKYKRLGKFSLDDNSKSNYQARESKTVYLDTEWQYLKFVMSECHINKYNIFNQVSIQSIKCYGYIIIPSKRRSTLDVNNEYSDSGALENNKSTQQIMKFYNELNFKVRKFSYSISLHLI